MAEAPPNALEKGQNEEELYFIYGNTPSCLVNDTDYASNWFKLSYGEYSLLF